LLKGQLTFSWEELHASPSVSQDSEAELKTIEGTSLSPIAEFLKELNRDGSSGKTSQVSCHRMEDGILVPSSGRWSNSGMGSVTEFLTLNTLEFHSGVVASSLLDVLETGDVPQKFFLSAVACEGILRRAANRKKTLPAQLEHALAEVSGRKTPKQDMS
jgi:hypothetical protein